MKIKILIGLLFITAASAAQPGYLPRNTKERLIATIADSGLHVPVFDRPRVPAGIAARDGGIFLDSIGGGRGLYYVVDGVPIRLRDTTEAGSRVVNGLKISADTTLLGDSLDRYTYLQIRSNFINNSSFNALRIGNLTEANSVNGVVGLHPLFNTYRPSPFSIETLYSTANGDVDSAFYGGNVSTLFRLSRDSTDAQFGAGKRNEYLPGIGGEFVGQYFPPRDTTVLKIGRDGQSGNLLFGQFDLGNSYGYNLNLTSPSDLPSFPLSVGRTIFDLSRVSDNTRRKKLTGNGISGFTTMYKSYQTAINMSTYEAGNYTENVFGLRAYGDAYPLISGATKAKTLAVWEVKNAYGLYVDPQYRYTNTVDNGYSFYAAGDTDLFVNRGFAYFGPNSPTRQNNTEGLRYRGYFNGKVWVTDSSHAFIADAYGMSVQIPKSTGDESTIGFSQKDSLQTASIGAVQPTSRDGRYLLFRIEGFNAATYPDASPGMYIRFETGANHANVSRISRNGNWTLGNSAAALNYRWYKKLAVDGGGVFRDTLKLEVAPLQVVDTTNYKVVARNTTTGDLLTMPWVGPGGGGGGSGTVTDFIFTDANGFDGTVSTSTSTPTLSINSTVADTRVLYSTSGALTGSGQLTFTGQALQLSSTNTTQATTSSGFAQTYNSLTTGTGEYIASSSLTTGNLLNLVSTSTAANSFSLANLNSSGANANSSRTAIGQTISVTNTGTTSTNYGMQVTASGATNNWGIQSTPNIIIGSPTLNANDGLILTNRDNGNYSGISIYSNNLATRLQVGQAGITRGGGIDINTTSGSISLSPTTGVYIGASFTSATALLHLAAGSTSRPPMRWTSGPIATGGNILAGNMEFLTDKWYGTITTGPAAYEFTMNNAALTSGTTPVATTNGRLTDGLILAQGTWTPTIAGLSNVSSSSNPNGIYTRVGNKVNFTIFVSITPTAGTTNTSFTATLPIASDLTAATDVIGNCAAQQNVTYVAGFAGAATASDVINVQFGSINTTAHSVYVTGQYLIQ